MSVHKFDPENRKKLNSKQRQTILPPAQVLMDIGFGFHTVWADIGCGTGFFTIPLANEVRGLHKELEKHFVELRLSTEGAISD